jgi:hypothetical protein
LDVSNNKLEVKTNELEISGKETGGWRILRVKSAGTNASAAIDFYPAAGTVQNPQWLAGLKFNQYPNFSIWRFTGSGGQGGHQANHFTIDASGNVGINTNTPVTSASLTVGGTRGGFLPPRMTSIQANAIVSPAEGLMIYVTNTGGTPFNFTAKGWWGYNGSTWIQLG